MSAKQSILLVDDSESDLKLMRMAFQKAEFEGPPLAVRDGDEAIAYLNGDGPYSDRDKFPLPTVMLLDLNMPRMSGFDVLEWLRAHPTFKRITVVILTASARTEDIERAFALGANSFLVKPSNFDELIAMIRTLRDWLRYNHFPPLNESVRR